MSIINTVCHQVELETQKAGHTIATLQATSEMRSAVHDQLQIDLELIAAKECIERLADRKEVIAQRRFDSACTVIIFYLVSNDSF